MALVLGNEVTGVDERVLGMCDAVVEVRNTRGIVLSLRWPEVGVFFVFRTRTIRGSRVEAPGFEKLGFLFETAVAYRCGVQKFEECACRSSFCTPAGF